MSDTPRTDALLSFHDSSSWTNLMEHARQLERELNQAKNDCDGLMLTVQELRYKISTPKD
jgi:hypothetical protein